MKKWSCCIVGWYFSGEIYFYKNQVVDIRRRKRIRFFHISVLRVIKIRELSLFHGIRTDDGYPVNTRTG